MTLDSSTFSRWHYSSCHQLKNLIRVIKLYKWFRIKLMARRPVSFCWACPVAHSSESTWLHALWQAVTCKARVMCHSV